MRHALLAILSIGVIATGTAAQTARKPGAEEARLGYFAGRWTLEGEGRNGKFTENANCDWFAGRFHLVCRTDVTALAGAVTGQFIMGYDWLEKTYTYYEINSLGIGVFVRGTVSGKVWTWQGEFTMEGKRMKQRMTITEQSPNAFLVTFETSIDGAPFMVTTQLRATRM